MDSIEEALNKIISSITPQDIKEMSDLFQDSSFIIKNLKRTDTKNGETLLAELQLKYGDNVVDYSVFLPQRDDKLPQWQIDILNNFMPEIPLFPKKKMKRKASTKKISHK